MKTLGVIPARYASTRFPGKPLTLINGKSMIRRVYEQASRSQLLSALLVATDDERIFHHVMDFGGKAVMTAESHPSGTDRCAETLLLSGSEYDFVINIQGDEPYIHPEQIDLVVSCLQTTGADIATLVKVINDVAELDNINIPKVIRSRDGRALYFSRQVIPYCKEELKQEYIQAGVFYRHIGIYGYRGKVLPALAALPQGILEQCESLEQLRWLENGFSIYTDVSTHENISVDVPSDVHLIETRFKVSD